MTTAAEYRRKAQEYLDLARAVSLETDRAILLDIAQNYLQLAEEQEAPKEISPPVTEQPQPVAQQQQQVQPKGDDKKD